MSSLPLLAARWNCPPSAAAVAPGLQWPIIPNTAPEISANVLPTMSIVSYVRNRLGEIPGYRTNRKETDKTGTETLSRLFLPDVQMTAVPGVTGEPGAVLRAPGSPDVSWNPRNPLIPVEAFPPLYT